MGFPIIRIPNERELKIQGALIFETMRWFDGPCHGGSQDPPYPHPFCHIYVSNDETALIKKLKEIPEIRELPKSDTGTLSPWTVLYYEGYASTHMLDLVLYRRVSP